MEENRKKFNWKILFIIVMAGALVFCLFRINSMSDEIASLASRNENYQNQINSLQSELNSIYDNVDAQLKQEASLLSRVDHALGELDTETHTVPVTLRVVPKTITEDMRLLVRIGDESADFVREGDAFTATIPIGLFVGYDQYPMLSIQTAEGIKTEYLESVDITDLHHRYLPSMYAEMFGSCAFGDGTLRLDAHITIDCKPFSPESNASLTRLSLVAELNGEEIDRQDLTSEIQDGAHSAAFDQSYPVKEGEELLLYAVAEDSMGYTHKRTLWYWFGGDETQTEVTTVDGSEYIYDKDGNLLNGEQ